MGRIGLVVLFLLFGTLACSESTRDNYDMPKKQKVTDAERLEIVLEELSERIKSNPSNPWNYYKRAMWHYRAEMLDEALIDVSRAERLSPNSGNILYLKSAILYKSDKKKSLENALYAEGQGYTNPDLFTLIGNLYLDKKDLPKAWKYFKQAEEIYPYNANVYFGRGKYFAMNRDTGTAILNYRRAISLKQSEFEYYDNLIKIYSEFRLIDSALVFNERAIQNFPKNNELVYTKAFILEKAGVADQAISGYRRFVSLEPTRLETYGRIGDIYLRHKNYSAAFSAFNTWAKLDSGNVKPTLKAAKTYILQQNYYAAKNYIENALTKFPENKELVADLSLVQYRIDQYNGFAERNYNKQSRNKEKDTELKDERVFDRSLEISRLPKRKPIGFGRDSL